MAENRKLFEQIVRRDIDQISMCYILISSTRQVLQTDGKLFSNFEIIFTIK